MYKYRTCDLSTKTKPIFIVRLYSRNVWYVRGLKTYPKHEGVDIAVPCGTRMKVYGVLNGRKVLLTVCSAPLLAGYGYAASYKLGRFSLFVAHLMRMPEPGSSIVYTGKTGDADGCHVHIECFFDHILLDPVRYCRVIRNIK